MTQIEALISEAKDAPEALIGETLDFLRFLKFQHIRQKGHGDWTEQDMHAYAVQSLQYAAQLYGDEEDLLPVEGMESDHASAR
ncbi:MAG TPA: hypothetical protein VKU00_26595 [Chthonomonadaceae bacterium]|nr:hypothetical protein [Chthonomonadaceae bacterium]